MNEQTSKLGKYFAWFNTTQCLGALNDNMFQLFLIFYLIELLGKGSENQVSAIAGAVFVVPFLIFTAFAGKLADRLSKRNIIVAAKVVELVVMVLACAAFTLQSPFIMYAILFLMCTQSAFFGPSKYGIVPELVRTDQLSKANSFLEGLTYLGIVTGVAVASAIAKITGQRYLLWGFVCVAISVAGLFASLRISKTAPAGNGKGASVLFLRDIWRTLLEIRKDKQLVLAVFASGYFMLISGFMKMNLIPYGIQELNFSAESSGFLFLAAAVGIGLGAFQAGRLSGRNIEFGIVPLGALGMALCSIVLGFVITKLIAVIIIIFLMGVSAGLFIVPVHAFIQLQSPVQIRGQVLAASGFLGWVGIALAAGFVWFLGKVPAGAAKGFIAAGFVTLMFATTAIIMLPDFLVRLLVVVLARIVYRIRVHGEENLPVKDGVLLVVNHVSWVDSVLLASALTRRIRFVIERQYYDLPWVNWLCRLMKAIPISASDPPKKIVASLREARQAMADGYVVCIFAEGAITRTGLLGKFRAGFERITRGTGFSIIPAYIGGAWGSIFSHYHGPIMSTLPKKLQYPISIHFGQPMQADSTAQQIRDKVSELSCDYFESLKPSRIPLAGQFVKTARKNWRRKCVSDVTGTKLNYGRTLAGSIAFAEQIGKITGDDKNVGLLLPPSVGGAMANIAVGILGKVTVNLNYTASREILVQSISKCGINCVLSSKKFIEKAKLPADLPGLVYLEDIKEKITAKDKRRAFVKAMFMPWSRLVDAKGFSADDVATIIFSSGSTGVPKGVMLTHHNITSNIEAAKMVFKFYKTDRLCAVLPFFHSFGLSLTLWLVVTSGASACYLPNPLDGTAVAKMVRKLKLTMLFATPTFLVNYIRRAEREDFASLREVIVGAAKLKQSLVDSFEEKFGITCREGFGATELSPLVSVNLADAEIAGVKQVGTKAGSVGHPVPGVVARIVDIETQEPLPFEQEGLLLVKGPNVMKGYLGMPSETAEVIRDGWYNTGDIARMDEEGFITITDRLSRFSKIAGEMVPHMAIEQLCADAIGSTEQLVAVTSVPESKRGEELIVLYLEQAGDAQKLYEIVSNSDLPNIYKPKRENFIKVDSLPMLGSGKLNIMKMKEMALTAKQAAVIQPDTSVSSEN